MQHEGFVLSGNLADEPSGVRHEIQPDQCFILRAFAGGQYVPGRHCLPPEWRVSAAVLGSLAAVRESVQLQQQLDLLKDLALIRQRVSQVEKKSDITQRIERAEEAAVSTISRLDISGLDSQSIERQRTALVQGLQTLRKTEGAAPRSELSAQLAAQGALLLESIVEQAGLSQNDEPRVRQLSTLIAVQVPRLSALLNNARTLGSITLGQATQVPPTALPWSN